jgi:hypothetical protein
MDGRNLVRQKRGKEEVGLLRAIGQNCGPYETKSLRSIGTHIQFDNGAVCLRHDIDLLFQQANSNCSQPLSRLLKIKFQPSADRDLISADALAVTQMDLRLTRSGVYPEMPITALRPEPDNGPSKSSERVDHDTSFQTETLLQEIGRSRRIGLALFGLSGFSILLLSYARDRIGSSRLLRRTPEVRGVGQDHLGIVDDGMDLRALCIGDAGMQRDFAREAFRRVGRVINGDTVMKCGGLALRLALLAVHGRGGDELFRSTIASTCETRI